MKSPVVILIVLFLTAGCVQPTAPPVDTVSPAAVSISIPEYDKPISATVERIDSKTILITYEGGADADQLIELETTVINSKGSVTIQSMGSRLDTTPVQRRGTDIIHGPFSEKVHVLITGYFFNGTHQDVLDTWI